MMDALCGVFTGAAFAGKVGCLYTDNVNAQDVGHFILCVRPDLFMPMDEFKARMDHLVSTCKEQPMAEGFNEILMPGEPETRAEEERTRSGIPLQVDVVEKLKVEAEKHRDVIFPDPCEE